MLRIYLSLILILSLFMPLNSFADKPISFKGIKFGMKAAEIARIGGGNTEYGCASAIKDEISLLLEGGNQPWTYGGIDSWSASCMEGYDDEANRVPGVTGLYQITALVASKNNKLAKWNDNNTYSVDELVEIFSKQFGKFNIETKVVKDGLGQEFIKKDATAIRGGALMKISDTMVTENHENYIRLKIVSNDYLTKKNALEKKKSSDKIKDAKSDF